MTSCSLTFGQSEIESKKGSLYFYWGFNRSVYSKTDLHFTGPNFDFTLYDVKATDRPTPLGFDYIDPTKITIPQNNYRLGYFISDRFSLSIGLDHMKYVITQDQEVNISGVITEMASTIYKGAYLNEPIKLKDDLLKFEHTDGLNLFSFDVEYLFPLKNDPNKLFSYYWNSGLGGIWVVTKTNVKIFGDGLDNDYHIAGYHLACKTGPRIEFKNRLFLLAEVKSGFANLRSVLVKNEAPEKGNHNIGFIEFYIALGTNFRF